jgi:hypothetical protein
MAVLLDYSSFIGTSTFFLFFAPLSEQIYDGYRRRIGPCHAHCPVPVYHLGRLATDFFCILCQIKTDAQFFIPRLWNAFFAFYRSRALEVYLEKTPSIVYESGSIGTTLDPPIFWLDNNFNALSKFYRL